MPKTNEEYLINCEENRCPFCDSKDTSIGNSWFIGDEGKRIFMCNSCDQEWHAIYAITGYEERKSTF